MTGTPTPRHRLYVMGGRDLVGPGGSRVSSVLAQPKRLCLLTYLAMAGGPVSRAKLTALFWPESDEARARNALSQAVFYLRKSLGRRAIESVEGDQVRVRPERVWCDARAFLAGEIETAEAIGASRGDVLDGWNADDSQPLQEWLDTLRREVRAFGAELQRAGRGAAVAAPDGRTDAPVEGRTDARVEGAADREPGSGRLRRRSGAVLAAAVGFVVVVALARWSMNAADGAEAGVDAPEDAWAAVVLLQPALYGADAPPPGFNEATRILIAAELAGIPGLVSSTATASSATEARRELQAIGEPVEDKWFLSVLTSLEGRAAKVTILLGDGSRNYPANDARLVFADRQALSVEGPRRIARHVARTVATHLPELMGGR